MAFVQVRQQYNSADPKILQFDYKYHQDERDVLPPVAVTDRHPRSLGLMNITLLWNQHHQFDLFSQILQINTEN